MNSDHPHRLPWRQGPLHHSYANVPVSHAQWILANYPRLGVMPSKSLRFCRARDILTARPAKSDKDLANPEDRLEAERIVGEFYFIGRTLMAHTEVRSITIHDKLDCMMGGAFARIGLEPDQPRDTQFELLLYCVCLQGGLPIEWGEPDFRTWFGHERIGLAAKRVGSTDGRRVRARVNKAIGQISRSGLRGLVVMNMDSATLSMNPPDMSTPLPSRGVEFDRHIAIVRRAFEKRKTCPDLLGVVVFGLARSVRKSGNISHALIHYFCKTMGIADSEEEWQTAQTFWGAIERGMDNFVRIMST